MFERPRAGERSILVQLAMGSRELDEDRIEEFRLLAEAAGAEIVAELGGRRDSPEPRLFVGSGKADELKGLVAATEVELVIFDHALTPAQERNLERLLGCRVVDRNGLVLDIFAQRARSFEGKLQVELAQLRHLSTRLVRGWTHLERQKGGIGLRGPGETQLESDRRLLGKRIAVLNERLSRIETQRAQGRRARERAAVPTVSLVGYTNAGKSTLFNRLTEAGVIQADQLFATLDPTLRRLTLPDAPPVVLADTVGFINELPHELVAAFRSTLKETCSAQMLLHVVDAGAEQRDRRIGDVNDVLARIGADAIPCIQVFNKLDTLGRDASQQGPNSQLPRVDRDSGGRVQRVWLSARTGAGIELLLMALAEHFRGRLLRQRIRLGPADGRLRAWLFANAKVVRDAGTDLGGWDLLVEMAPRMRERHLLGDSAWSGRLVGEPESLDSGLSDPARAAQPISGATVPHPSGVPSAADGSVQRGTGASGLLATAAADV